ncbi:MAG TPA: hypothetical protein VGN83_22265 [Falsiroseomonas sp.]|jgi:hypothetical protein|nr:hypothetical protein [Falsiroseomonas sp.]
MKEGRLVLGVPIQQLICWGTLCSSVPVFIAPMEAELGRSWAEFSGAVTAGLLAALDRPAEGSPARRGG